MIDFISKARYGYEDLVRLVKILRGPGGCPWDGAQTHLSIRRNLLEEAYEACEGFDKDDPALMCEELGDVLLQVLFHADIEEDAGRFTLEDVCDGVCKKLIFRHPFLFSTETPGGWEEMKQLEKGQKTATETLDAVARSLPALWRSEKIQNKAAKAGFKRESVEQTLGKLEKDTAQLRKAVCEGGDVQQALGEVLFTAVGVASQLQTDPEDALHETCEKFIRCFGGMEQAAKAGGKTLQELSREELRSLWNDQNPRITEPEKI